MKRTVVRDRYQEYLQATGALIELTGPAIRLRYVRLDDAPQILELLRDPAVSRFFLWEPPRDLAAAQRYVEGFQREIYERRAFHFAVLRAATEELLGIVNLYHIDPLASEAEVGIWLGQAYWGQGVQQEANDLLLGFGFRGLRLERLVFRVALGNARAQAAIRKLGVTERGCVALFSARQEQMVDHRVYELEAAQWKTHGRSD